MKTGPWISIPFNGEKGVTPCLEDYTEFEKKNKYEANKDLK